MATPHGSVIFGQAPKHRVDETLPRSSDTAVAELRNLLEATLHTNDQLLRIAVPPDLSKLSGLTSPGDRFRGRGLLIYLCKQSPSGRPVQPWPFLRSGQIDRVQASPLVAAEGILLQMKGEYHPVVSVTLLQ